MFVPIIVVVLVIIVLIIIVPTIVPIIVLMIIDRPGSDYRSVYCSDYFRSVFFYTINFNT